MNNIVERASMKMIAREVGVSLMTVSRAMNKTGYVAAETARRIQEVADRIQYRPNRLVRGMQTGRTGLVGVVMPAGLGFYSGVLDGIHDHLSERDAGLLLSLVHGNWEKRAIDEEQKILHRLIELRVDGIILRPANDEATDLYFDEIVQRGVPIVVIDRRVPKFACDFVGTDDAAGGEMAAATLLARGRKNFLLVTAGNRFSPSRDRAKGFRDTVAAASGATSLDILEFPSFTHNENEILEFLTARGSKVDGIFAVNDNMALGCKRALLKLGRRIPEDVSIIGFGAVAMGDGYFVPVSTFDQHPDLIGRTASEMLFARIDRKSDANAVPPKTVRLAATFVDRGT
jgi:LacI family transcriptional regulator